MSTLMHAPSDTLVYPWPKPPAYGAVQEVAPGILWLRMELPFRLNHINVYLIEHDDGWTVIDTGFGIRESQIAWERVFVDVMGSKPIHRLIVTHWHPDHSGLAGWITERFQCPLSMTMIEYLMCLYFPIRRSEEHLSHQEKFLHRHGMDPVVVEQMLGRGQDYMRRITGIPPSFERLSAGDRITIGTREFELMTGGGHSADQLMMLSRADNLFFAADQVLAKISPNVSVHSIEPLNNALGHYLTSLTALARTLPDDVLVLPGHGVPFYGVKTRIQELQAHHAARCNDIEVACRTEAKTSAQIVPFVFPRELDPHQTGFATSEVIAHINYMIAEGRLVVEEDKKADILRFRAKS
jgi:glyoxylase-like metal-dependent hydrolase (beta-lactamase superfamily II)